MKRRAAEAFFSAAREYVREHYPEEIRTVRAIARRPFIKITAQEFLREYAWVVYGAFFNVDTLEQMWPALKRAFRRFELPAVANMRSPSSVLKVFGNRRKAECVLRGARAIAAEGFPAFRSRIASAGTDSLTHLPGIGPVTKDLLARNTGLENTAKNDVWIKRLVTRFGAQNHDELAGFLARRTQEPIAVVDTILWRFCRDHGWKHRGASSLADFCSSLA